MNDNFRKKKSGDNKQRYLRYDDVFISPKSANKQRNTRPFVDYNEPEVVDDMTESDDVYEDGEYQDYVTDDDPREGEYFAGKNNIINERMVRYQRRRLPPLQRYTPNSHRDAYAEYNQSYWDDERGRQRHQRLLPLRALWQKFMVTFAAILSLICISWLVYNWNNTKSNTQYAANGIPIIEPGQPTFKVLPEAPGGAEIAYKDKSVYSKVDGSVASNKPDERLLPPQEDTFDIPEQSRSVPYGNDVEEYSIVSDKIYFIKISAGKDRQVLINEAKLLKKKHANLFEGKEVFVKKVSNSRGETQRAILVGPYTMQDAAITTAQRLDMRCSVISVKEE